MSKSDNSTDTYQPRGSVWMRGLHMVIFAVLFGMAETLLLALAFIQFCWMLFTGDRNGAIAEFGASLGNWLQHVAAFQSGATDDKPFPWRRWE